jgi:hypothetical protein
MRKIKLNCGSGMQLKIEKLIELGGMRDLENRRTEHRNYLPHSVNSIGLANPIASQLANNSQ